MPRNRSQRHTQLCSLIHQHAHVEIDPSLHPAVSGCIAVDPLRPCDEIFPQELQQLGRQSVQVLGQGDNQNGLPVTIRTDMALTLCAAAAVHAERH